MLLLKTSILFLSISAIKAFESAFIRDFFLFANVRQVVGFTCGDLNSKISLHQNYLSDKLKFKYV